MTGVLAPNPVTVWPLTEPTLLANSVTVCTPKLVLFILIIPLLSPHVALVNVNVELGLGLTMTVIVFVPIHPPVEPVIV